MSPAKKIYLSLAISSLLTVGFIIFIIYPLLTGTKENSEELIAQKKQSALVEAKTENLAKFKIVYQGLEPSLEKISNLFIDPEVPVEFIGFLEKNAKDCQTTIKIFSTLPQKTKPDPWPSLTFQIMSSSSFPNFLKFLEKLEASPYLIEIKNLNVVRLSEGEVKLKEFGNLSLGDVKTTLSLKVFAK